MNSLSEQIKSFAHRKSFDQSTIEEFLRRIEEGLLTRDENEQTHFCVYFFPYNSRAGDVFVVHHKKAQQWLAPGGHIDKRETLLDTLNREIEEELGVRQFYSELENPFLLTITPINNDLQPCKAHYDIWYLMNTDGSDFRVDPAEFYETRWVPIATARELLRDENNLKALEFLTK